MARPPAEWAEKYQKTQESFGSSTVTRPLLVALLRRLVSWLDRSMNADAVVLLLLAVADICLLAYLRQRRARSIRAERMTRSLRLHIRGELALDPVVAPRRRQMMQRAS